MATEQKTMTLEITPEEAAFAMKAILAFPQTRQDPLFMAGNTLFEKIRNGARKQIELEQTKTKEPTQ